MEESTKKIEKSLLINRLLLIANLILLCVIIGGAALVSIKGMKIYGQLKPAIDEVAKIDFTKIDELMNTIDEINQIDIKSMGESIESIDFDTIADLVDSIDVEEIKKVMDNVKTASDMLETVNEKVAPVLGWFTK